jgi:hypothetical protein
VADEDKKEDYSWVTDQQHEGEWLALLRGRPTYKKRIQTPMARGHSQTISMIKADSDQ